MRIYGLQEPKKDRLSQTEWAFVRPPVPWQNVLLLRLAPLVSLLDLPGLAVSSLN
jgi:hypothetical protein